MFAVIKTGGKQFRVAADDVITIHRLDAEPGERVAFGEVLMLGGEGGTSVGAPHVSGASVSAEVVALTRGPKVIAFKKRRRKNSKRKRGHRQDLTQVRIVEILTDGAQPSRPPAQAAMPVEGEDAAGASA